VSRPFSAPGFADFNLVYLNLPICFVAFVVLAISLRGAELDCSKDASWQTFLTKFDFLGLYVDSFPMGAVPTDISYHRVLFISGSSCIIVGFSFAASSGCEQPIPACLERELTRHLSSGIAASTLTLIIIGAVLLLCAGVYEWKTTRDALFPPSAFKSSNVGE
jgi:hypothetical protein